MIACFISALLAAEGASASARGEARPEAGAQGVSDSAELHHQGPASAHQQSGGRHTQRRQLQLHLSQVSLTKHRLSPRVSPV